MLEKTKKKPRFRGFYISLEMREKIKQVCGDDISTSSFVRMAIKKELRRRGIE